MGKRVITTNKISDYILCKRSVRTSSYKEQATKALQKNITKPRLTFQSDILSTFVVCYFEDVVVTHSPRRMQYKPDKPPNHSTRSLKARLSEYLCELYCGLPVRFFEQNRRHVYLSTCSLFFTYSCVHKLIFFLANFMLI